MNTSVELGLVAQLDQLASVNRRELMTTHLVQQDINLLIWAATPLLALEELVSLSSELE